MVANTPQELKDFVLSLCPVVIENKSAGNYIKFGQNGIVKQYVSDPLISILDTTTFCQALTDYAADKARLIVKDWPSIRTDKNGNYLIRTTLVGDDGTKEIN